MLRKASIIVILISLSSACKEDDGLNRVPSVPVDITMSLNLPQWQAINSPGGWVYVTGGSRGIIIYRISQSDFMAMDRHCPYEPQEFDRVDVLDNNIIAQDSLNCGSKFVLTDGSVTQGPAVFPLTTYQTTFNGTTNQLRVFN